MTASIIFSKELRNVFGDSPPEKAALDPVLDEAKKLRRDLTAIRDHINKHLQESKTSQEWKMIGTVMDRLLFSIYFLFIVITFITIAVIWGWSRSYVFLEN